MTILSFTGNAVPPLPKVKYNGWYAFLYRNFGYTPSFLGVKVKSMRFYDEFRNHDNNTRFLRDKVTGEILRR